jgi:hypothetical protein
LGNITNSPVYLFHGQSDSTVYASVNGDLYTQYQQWGADVVYRNDTQANHAWISPLATASCTTSSSPYVSNCNIDPELDILSHMLKRKINPSSSSANGSVYSFSQDSYAQKLYGTSASTFSMDTTGYVYLPSSCANGAKCELLIVLHGCLQGYSMVGGALIAEANLNGYADTNNLIILYPQAIASPLVSNPEGCWDWWGYTGTLFDSKYVTRAGPQMAIIRAIAEALGFTGKPVTEAVVVDTE